MQDMVAAGVWTSSGGSSTSLEAAAVVVQTTTTLPCLVSSTKALCKSKVFRTSRKRALCKVITDGAEPLDVEQSEVVLVAEGEGDDVAEGE